MRVARASIGGALKSVLLSSACWLLVACGKQAGQDLPTLTVTEEALVISTTAYGELAAVNSTPISAPPNATGPQQLNWIAPMNVVINAGDIVARFDGTTHQLEAEKAAAQMTKLDIEMKAKLREMGISLDGLANGEEVVDLELLLAERFTLDNELIYSRSEIIDKMLSKDYLAAQDEYYGAMRGHHTEKSGAEMGVLQSRHSGQAQQYQRSSSSLENLEIKAPHDGILVYEKNWMGEPVRVGDSIFPGQKIARIPDMSKLKAELNIEESASQGLEEGLSVEVVLLAYPDRPISGKVTSVSHSATPIARDNPVKYFGVDVLLDSADPNWMTPGSSLRATIQIARVEQAISVPNQTIYQDEEGDWVYLKHGAEYRRQKVELGLRSQTRTQIIGGLQAGDQVALLAPEPVS